MPGILTMCAVPSLSDCFPACAAYLLQDVKPHHPHVIQQFKRVDQA